MGGIYTISGQDLTVSAQKNIVVFPSGISGYAPIIISWKIFGLDKERIMKIVEGLKKLNVIKKRISKNCEEITQYASYLSTELPIFQTDDRQKEEVQQRIQSSEDLLREYLKLKRRIEWTNLKVTIELDGVKYSLSDLLALKRDLAARMINVYSALNTSAARGRLHRAASPDGHTPQIVMAYSEKEKNDCLRRWQDLYDNIDSRLEVINATTDLLEAEEL